MSDCFFSRENSAPTCQVINGMPRRLWIGCDTWSPVLRSAHCATCSSTAWCLPSSSLTQVNTPHERGCATLSSTFPAQSYQDVACLFILFICLYIYLFIRLFAEVISFMGTTFGLHYTFFLLPMLHPYHQALMTGQSNMSRWYGVVHSPPPLPLGFGGGV